MLPTLEAYGGWPASGEIDIVEGRGNAGVPGGSAAFGSTIHYGPSWQADPWYQNHAEYTLPDTTFDFADDFHVFGLYWDEHELYTYVDDESTKVLHATFNESFWDAGTRDFPEWKELYTNPWRASPNLNAPYDQSERRASTLSAAHLVHPHPTPQHFTSSSTWQSAARTRTFLMTWKGSRGALAASMPVRSAARPLGSRVWWAGGEA